MKKEKKVLFEKSKTSFHFVKDAEKRSKCGQASFLQFRSDYSSNFGLGDSI